MPFARRRLFGEEQLKLAALCCTKLSTLRERVKQPGTSSNFNRKALTGEGSVEARFALNCNRLNRPDQTRRPPSPDRGRDPTTTLDRRVPG